MTDANQTAPQPDRLPQGADKPYRDCMAEIIGVLKKYDMAGAITVVSKEHLQVVSEPFGKLAQHIVDTLPSNPERTAGLRKLLEAKDCAVRALLFK